MRIAVYNQHWATAGGGEKFAGAIAQVLREHHDVTVLANGEVDLAELDERLALDMTGLPVEQVGLAGRLEAVSASYDLLVNASFKSSDRNGAPKGIYVVHFPHDAWPSFSPKQRFLIRVAGPLLGARRPFYETGAGFYRADPLRALRVWWTDGDGELQVQVPAGRKTKLHLLFANLMPPGGSSTVAVDVDGKTASSVRVGESGSLRSRLVPAVASLAVEGRTDGRPLRLHIRSEVCRSAYEEDPRDLGVPLIGVAMGASPLSWFRAYASILRSSMPSNDFLDSYDMVLSNSAFTQRWVREYWGRESQVLNPPVTMRSPSASKDQIILSIGRFFPPNRGHSKKQLEMVEAFGRLVRAGRAPGWELHLVGGCAPEDRPYLDEVRAASEGLPVVLHIGATGEEVDSLYERSAIYWHATGYGEDVERHPDRMEHFGITTVEAMSAGAVPVAYGEAGPLEAFDDGVEGFHFHTLDRLVDATALLISEPDRRSRMAGLAVARAQGLSMEHFSLRTNAYVDQLAQVPPGR